MKFFTLIIGSLLSFSALAYDARLVVQLQGLEFTTKWKAVELKSLNTQLKMKGLPGFESTITLTAQTGKREWNKILKQVADANRILNRKIQMIDNGYIYQMPATCYKDTTASVMDTINALRGSFFHEDMGISLVRFGKNKLVFYPGQTIEDNKDVLADQMQNNPEVVNFWKKYDTKSDAVVILGDLGPQGDGTELHLANIPRCL